MNIQYYFHKVLFYLTPPILVVLLYLYGGTAAYFDYIYIGALVMSGYFCRKDIDTLGTLIILLAYWLGSEVLFIIPDSWISQSIIYSICIGLSAYYFNHLSAKILIAFVLSTVLVEVHWWHIEYASKPPMAYYVGVMALTFGIQRLLYNRAMIMHDYFKHTAGKLALDGHVRRILRGYYVLFALMSFEYVLRHVGQLKDALFIYNIFTPVSTLISAFTLAVVYMHYFYNQSKKHHKV